jgi:hypothetical protein
VQFSYKPVFKLHLGAKQGNQHLKLDVAVLWTLRACLNCRNFKGNVKESVPPEKIPVTAFGTKERGYLVPMEHCRHHAIPEE